MRDDLFYWLALHREFIWKFTPRELYYIKRSFNTIQDFWKATDAQLRHFAEEINMKKSKIEYFIKRNGCWIPASESEAMNFDYPVIGAKIKSIACLKLRKG